MATHNAFLAHGKAVQVIRKYSKSPWEIGYAPVGAVMFPDTNSLGDIQGTRVRKGIFESFELENKQVGYQHTDMGWLT